VIKIEPIDGDPYRHLIAGGTPVAKTTAGKSSICIDLKKPAGQEIAADLLANADVVVHNWRPGVAERLGLGETELRAVNPQLIWVSVTGYGRHSPSAARPATHPCAGAASGGAGRQAGEALGAPCDSLDDVREISRQLMRANESNPDPNTGVVAAAATLLALVARERFGMGQAVHDNMLAANLYANADDALTYPGKQPARAADAELHGLDAGYRLYPTADGWLFLAATTDAEWRRSAEVLGIDIAADARFTDGAARAEHDAALVDLVTERLATASADEWERRFVAVGIAGVRADAASPGVFWSNDEQVLANDFTPVCTHARFGTHRRWGPVVLVDGGPPTPGPGVVAGAQTAEILARLGHSPDEVDALRVARVVASEPVAWT
jgi:crotonobetainyl-CoA:carnitine CoA-transferase CaiB-like acyl-CoA transferase